MEKHLKMCMPCS